jgi:multicomponent K+:H+ antiporter subunit E
VKWFSRMLPAPLLSAALLLLWLALARSLSAGQIIMGAALAFTVPLITTSLRPATVRVRRPLVILRYLYAVVHDVIVSNVQVAWGVLVWRWRPAQARFVVIPLDLRDPHGLAVLAIVTTIVPGTVWSEIALDRRALLLHVWNVSDEADFIRRYKVRYEQPLLEIFE